MRIKLLKDWKPDDVKEAYPSGTILDVDKDEALKLIGDDLADRYRESIEPKKSPGADDPEAWKKMVKESVELAVKAATEEARKENKVDGKAGPRVEIGKDLVEDDPKLGFKSAGEFYSNIMKAGRGNENLPNLPKLAKLKAISGHSETIDADGGFLVPTEFRATLLERTAQRSNLAARCFNLPLGTNSVKIPYVDETSRATGSRGGAIQVYRLAEGAQYTSSKAKTAMLQLEAKKLGGLAYLTEELMTDNVISMEALISRLIADEMAWVIDDEIINGDGATEMLGILNADCCQSIDAEDGQAATTILTENIINMWAQLYAPCRANAVWLINQDCLKQLQLMTLDVGTGGTPTYMPPGGLTQAPYGTLMGRPVIEIEQCATLGTAGDIILGDFSQYVYATKGGLSTAQSIHLRFDYDETALKFTIRNDGKPWWRTVLTPANGTNYLAPFLKLATRS